MDIKRNGKVIPSVAVFGKPRRVIGEETLSNTSDLSRSHSFTFGTTIKSVI
jgi:hypothetical protein